jgi:polyisoprenyl-phosphate glycosyltransferase
VPSGGRLKCGRREAVVEVCRPAVGWSEGLEALMHLATESIESPTHHRKDSPRLLSLVVPVLNEQDAIQPFLECAVPHLEAAVALMSPSADYEIIFVDDGSTDVTVAVIAAAMRANPRVKAIVLSRNFGKDCALAAGLRHAKGDAVIPIDVDLQDPPHIIPELVRKWLSGAQVVTAIRTDRSSDSRLKRLSAKWFYSVYNRMSDRAIEGNVGDFRLLDRQVVNVVNDLPERARFMKGLFSWVGFETASVNYTREQRATGRSKWSYWRLWNFALDGITASTTAPLRVWTYCGVVIGAAAFLYGFFIIGMTFVLGRDVPGYASLITAILFFGGLNLIALGILGEYIGRIFNEVKARPLYVVRSTIGLGESGADPSRPGSA